MRKRLHTLCVLFVAVTGLNAQGWEALDLTATRGIAYDQRGPVRTLVTAGNVYRSVDGGTSYRRILHAANAPFLAGATADQPNQPRVEPFFGFDPSTTAVFGDVLFLTAAFGESGSAYTLYTSRDGGETLTPAFADSGRHTLPTLGRTWTVERVDPDRFLIVNRPADPSAPTEVFLSVDKAATWSPLGRFRESDLTYVGQRGSALAFLRAGQIVYVDAGSGEVVDSLGARGSYIAAHVDGRQVRTAAVEVDAQGAALVTATSDDGGASVAVRRTPWTLAAPTATQLTRDHAYMLSADETGRALLVRVGFTGQPGLTVLPDVGEATGFPLRYTADSLLVNAHPLPAHTPSGADESLQAGEPLRPSFLTSGDGWSTRQAVAVPDYDTRGLQRVAGGYLRIVGDAVYTTADGRGFTLGYRLGAAPNRIRNLRGALYTRSFEDPLENYFISPDGTTVVNGERAVVQGRDTLFSERFSIGGTGMYYSVDSGASFSYLNNGYFWQNGNTAFGDPVTGSLYDFRMPAGEDGRLHVGRPAVSRSDDGAASWRLLDSARFPRITDADFRYRTYDALFAHDDAFVVHAGDSLSYSRDGGATFTALTPPFSLVGAEVYRLGRYLHARLPGEVEYRSDLDTWSEGATAYHPAGAQVDLSLDVLLTPPEPAPGEAFAVTYVVSNHGTIAATAVGLRTYVASFSDAALRGNRAPSGNFDGRVEPGTAESVTTYWTRNRGALIRPWGEIRSQDEPDSDSRPGNGERSRVQEDDETSYYPAAANFCLLDSVPPSFGDCPADTLVPTNAGAVEVYFAVPEATDGCPGAVSVTSSHAPGDLFPLGRTTVTFVASDSLGNRDSCSFTVVVERVNAAEGVQVADGNPLRILGNPVTGQHLTVDFGAALRAERLLVYDATGEVRATLTVPASQRGEGPLRLILPTLPNGFYTLRPGQEAGAGGRGVPFVIAR